MDSYEEAYRRKVDDLVRTYDNMMLGTQVKARFMEDTRYGLLRSYIDIRIHRESLHTIPSTLSDIWRFGDTDVVAIKFKYGRRFTVITVILDTYSL